MKLTTGFKFGLGIFCQRRTIVILAIFSFSISCLLCSIYTFQGLVKEMSGEVELRCMVPDGMEDALRELEDISYVSEYQQGVQILSYNGYTAEVQLTGYEKEYFAERFRENITAEISGSMPYIVVESNVFSGMKNDSREKMNVESVNDLLMETFLVNGKKARVCGITDTAIAGEEDTQNPVFYVYTTLEGYGELTDLSGADESAQMQEDGSAGFSMAVPDDSSSGSFLVGVRNGFHLKKEEELLDKNGISILAQEGDENGEESDLTGIWEEGKDFGVRNAVLSVFLFLCSALLIRDQGKIWALEHRDFLRYIKMNDRIENSRKVIYAGAVLCYVMAGLGLGGVTAILRCMSF